MHIPDGYLSPTVFVIGFIIAFILWVISFKKVKLAEHQVPIMGLLTALFFAAQMMNYPVVGGTTAHLLGGTSLGMILGPFAGCISMTIILVLQMFLFGDGGITTLGANVLNMAVIGVFVPVALFLALNKLSKGSSKRFFAWIFISAFVGDLLAALAAGTELGLSTSTAIGGFPYGLSVVLPAMALNHSIIGVAEGIVTVVLIGALLKLRPDVLAESPVLKGLSILKKSQSMVGEEECR